MSADTSAGKIVALRHSDCLERLRRGTIGGVGRTLWRQRDPVPWAPGDRNLFIVITPQSVTGRIVTA